MKLAFNYTVEDSKNLQKGKYITCKSCKFKFKLNAQNKLLWIKQEMICPNCGILYCVKPKTERDLYILQEMFLLDKHNKFIQNEFYNLYFQYTRSLILKHFTNAINHPKDIEDCTHDAITKVFYQYLSKENFKINSSFGSYILFKIKESLWGKNENKNFISIHEMNEEGKEIFQIEDKRHKEKEFGIDEKEVLINDLYEKLLNLISKKKELRLKFLVSLVLYLKNGNYLSDKVFNSFGLQGKHLFLKVLEDFKEYLKNRKNIY